MSEREGVIRRQLLGELRRLSDQQPGLRVTQLIINAIPAEELERRQGDIYYIEDGELLGFLSAYERKNKSQEESS